MSPPLASALLSALFVAVSSYPKYEVSYYPAGPAAKCDGTKIFAWVWDVGTVPCFSFTPFNADTPDSVTNPQYDASTLNYTYRPRDSDCTGSTTANKYAAVAPACVYQTEGEAYYLQITCIQNAASDPECSGSYSPSSTSAGSSPCFAADTLACQLDSASVAPESAYDQCFGAATPTTAHRVPMSHLVAGDLVLSSSSTASAVVVTQHRPPTSLSSGLLTLHHKKGSLSLTPDHVLQIDGIFMPARYAALGSILSGGHVVTHVTTAFGDVINPVTLAGTILAAGPAGAPVLAATHPEWIAQWFLSASVPPLPLSFALARALPFNVQALYDTVVEPAVSATALPAFKSIWPSIPAPFAVVLLAAVDILFAAATVVHALCSLQVVIALSVVALSIKARHGPSASAAKH